MQTVEKSATTKMIANARNAIVQFLVPFVKWMGKVRAPWTVKDGIYAFYPLLDTLEVGDIILTETLGELSNIFNPGQYKHALVFVGDQQVNGRTVPCIIEAIGRGVVMRPLVEFLADKDKICVVRRRDKISKKQTAVGIQFLKEQIWKPYDYKFNAELGKMSCFYCSLLAYDFELARTPDFGFVPREILGVMTVAPTDFRLAEAFYFVVREFS